MRTGNSRDSYYNHLAGCWFRYQATPRTSQPTDVHPRNLHFAIFTSMHAIDTRKGRKKSREQSRHNSHSPHFCSW